MRTENNSLRHGKRQTAESEQRGSTSANGCIVAGENTRYGGFERNTGKGQGIRLWSKKRKISSWNWTFKKKYPNQI